MGADRVQNVVITGAMGFTGRHLASLLKMRGYSVHGLVQELSDHPSPTIQYHRCDLTNTQAITQVLADIRPDKIIHLAGVSFIAETDVEAIYRTNIVGTRNLLQAAVDCTLPINAVILASSANVYGNGLGTDGILAEDNVLAPTNDYAVSKLAMEYVGQIYRDRLPIIIARPFNYTGVGQNLNFLIPKVIDHIRRRSAYIELGNLDVARDFSDVRAVVEIYAALLEEQSAIGMTLNICSGRAYSLHDVIDMAQAISGHKIEVRVNPAFIRDHEVKKLIGSRARLDTLLPNLPNPPLEETLRWMFHEPNPAVSLS